jgi:predicted RNA-binding protein with PUA-like domain
MVDVRFEKKFKSVLPLSALKDDERLEGLGVIQRGSRLSIQPVTKSEFDIIAKLGRKKR